MIITTTSVTEIKFYFHTRAEFFKKGSRIKSTTLQAAKPYKGQVKSYYSIKHDENERDCR